MRCYNPACDSLAASEINVSVNVTETTETEEVDYTGETENGDYSYGIGTQCYECNEITFISNWKDQVLSWTNVASIVLDPKDDPWGTCRICFKVRVPDPATPCLECES